MTAKRAGKAKARKPRTITSERATAAVEVLEAVWLREDRFELEYEIDKATVTVDAQGNPWVTMRVLVPQLDVDSWADGEHIDQIPDADEDE